MASKLAGIQYMGEEGVTQDCLDAIMRLIQYGDKINRVRILSSSDRHCILLTIHTRYLIAIKSGFTTGYRGEWPRKFSYILQLFDAHKIEIDEYEVAGDLIDRLNNSVLTEADVKKIELARSVRPMRLYDEYSLPQHYIEMSEGTLWKKFRLVIPLALVDSRIIDLAITFWDNPDEKLLKGYRRFEDIVRERGGVDDSGSKLFSRVFLGDKSILHWTGISTGEQVARANLIISAYSAYRNPRAHKETKGQEYEYLSEFLLLNHLYLMEREAVKKE